MSSLSQAEKVCTAALAAARQGHTLWHDMGHKAISWVWSMFSSRLLGLEKQVRTT